MEGTAGITQTRATHSECGELGSPPSQNLEVPLLRATGRWTRTTTRAQSRGWLGLERVLESSPRFPGVSGMLIASDMSCSSCCIPCSGCPTAVAESSMIYSARRLLRGARGLFLLLLRPSGFAADPLQRWHRGCFYPLLISARRFPPAVAFLAFCSVIRRLRNASGVP